MSDHIPQDAMANILARLSFKDLITCRHVSKQWRTIIDSTHFISNQLQHSISTNSSALILLQREKGPLLYWKEEHAANSSDSSFTPRQYMTSEVVLMGSCHGLICMSLVDDRDPQDIIVLNPSTGDRHTFSSSKTDEEKALKQIAYGFGYDQVSEDYKVVRIMKPHYGYYIVEIYGVRTKSFSRIDNLLRGLWISDHYQVMGSFAGGALHWHVTDMNNMLKHVILSLDLGSETFRQIPQPRYFDNQNEWQLRSVSTVNSRLSLCALHGQSGKLDIWTMDEYGDIDSWHRIFSIHYNDSVVPLGSIGGRMLFNKDGDIFFWFDPEKKTTVMMRHGQILQCDPLFGESGYGMSESL